MAPRRERERTRARTMRATGDSPGSEASNSPADAERLSSVDSAGSRRILHHRRMRNDNEMTGRQRSVKVKKRDSPPGLFEGIIHKPTKFNARSSRRRRRRRILQRSSCEERRERVKPGVAIPATRVVDADSRLNYTPGIIDISRHRRANRTTPRAR